MNTLVSPGQTSGSNKTLWAAIAVMGVAVLAMGATLIRIQSQPTEPRLSVLPALSASAAHPASAPEAQTSAAAGAANSAASATTAKSAPMAQPSNSTAQVKSSVSTQNKPLAPVKKAQTATNSGATEIFEPSANPKVVHPQNPEPAVARPPEPTKVMCVDCGTVESVTPVEVQGTGSGAGAIAGGVLGAVVGNQVGDGNGKTLATILGAVGGGMAGNAVEKKMKKVTHYDVSVRMEDGSHRIIRQTAPASVGSQVRVQGDVLQPR